MDEEIKEDKTKVLRELMKLRKTKKNNLQRNLYKLC